MWSMNLKINLGFYLYYFMIYRKRDLGEELGLIELYLIEK